MTSKCMIRISCSVELKLRETQQWTAKMMKKKKTQISNLWTNDILENGCNKQIDGSWSSNNMKTNLLKKKKSS